MNDKTIKNIKTKIPKKVKKDFLEVLKVQSNSRNEKMIYRFLTNWLDEKGITNQTDAHGNIIAVKGKAKVYPTVVAHMDTVHPIYPSITFNTTISELDGNEILSASYNDLQVGTGGDDKNGVFAAMYLLEQFTNLKAVFFTKEEVGCVGSGDIYLSHFRNSGYILQLDRWGFNDFIDRTYTTTTINNEFRANSKDVLKKYGYKSAIGLITDSINLFKRDVGVSCVNISCGYYNHHTNRETIDLNEFWNSIKFTKELIQTLGETKYNAVTIIPTIIEKPLTKKEIKKQKKEDKKAKKRFGGDVSLNISTMYEFVSLMPKGSNTEAWNFFSDDKEHYALMRALGMEKIEYTDFLYFYVMDSRSIRVAKRYHFTTGKNLFATKVRKIYSSKAY